ncbi:MAG TPA: hypothetical protein VNH11_18970 [Pirellulales bacterium]|nr:hypothetical protein [Pirellulales bacterium]
MKLLLSFAIACLLLPGSSAAAAWINGVKISEFNGQTCTAANYDRQKVADLLGPEGSIAVQVHGGKSWPNGAKCRWKNVKIRPL